MVSSSEDDLVGLDEDVQERWVCQSHQMPPRFCGRRDVLWRLPEDERFPDQTWLLEAENSKLKKNLIIAMDEANTLKEKIKVIGDDLRTERQLTVEKDEQL